MAWAQRLLRLIPVASIALCLAGVLAGAGAAEERHGPFTVDSVTLEGLSGTLEVRIVEDGEVSLVVAGPEAAVAALTVEAVSGALTVKAPSAGGSVTVVERMTVVTGPGASSEVVIGGSSASSSAASSPGDSAPLDLVVEVPAGTRLAVLGFTGEAVIGDLDGAVRIEAVGGQVQLGAATDAALAAIGSGRVEVDRIAGDLSASVTGAGRVAVAGGSIGALTVDVTGDGVVVVEAPAATAVVNMIGSGEVRLAEVAAPPEVNRVGAGRFSVGAP
jgi:hypothetical protein